ncbi:MAG TPA: ABC transporter ATP-binding protein [Candidatus Fraserbacteria bacterium]|nr:ABC transporter ATP-binding protein [Candidatus Fraserbacteria bacterium]
MLLETKALTKDYRAGKEMVHALRGIDFQLEQGDFVALNGPSGSGKTTFLNLIACIDEPTSGEVLIEGHGVNNLSSARLAELRRDMIGLVFQAFNLIPVLSAYENVEYPLLLQRIPRKERRSRVMGLLEEVGLGRLAGRRPDELSGGEKQRVALARALVARPRLVLADEPTGNLDSETGQKVMAIMQRLNREHQVAVVLVTHDPAISAYAERAVKILDGRLQQPGETSPPAQEYLAAEEA